MASAKAKIRHVFGDTFSCRAAPPDILVELSGLHVRIARILCSNYVAFSGSPPTYTNKLCEWLVVTMKDNEL